MATTDCAAPPSTENDTPAAATTIEEPSFSDPEDFVDEGVDSEPSLLALERCRPTLNEDFSDVIIVDNVPQVGPDRLEKLKTALRKILSKFGTIAEDFYPVDKESGQTKGYIFVRFTDEQAALNARKQLDGHRLDKSHQFAVNTLKEFERYSKVSDHWEKPRLPEYVDCPTLLSWMMTESAVDQFSVVNNGGRRTSLTCSVFANTLPQPKCLLTRQVWTEKTFVWSPFGTYLASFHEKGIVMWGGENFEKLARIAHHNVSNILFSPCERFVITSAWSGGTPRSPIRTANIYVSDISVSTVRRTFTQDVEQRQAEEDSGTTIVIGGGDDGAAADIAPIGFKWSHDGQFFARLAAQDSISVYNSSNFSLVDRKSIKLPMIASFEWAPSHFNYMAVYQAERGEAPARVSVISIPSRDELRGNNLFNVAACKIHWQNRGDLVCFQLDRYIKQKVKEDTDKPQYMNLYHNFEIFHIRERNCPVDSKELKSNCLHFSWEPNGNRFVIIHEAGPGKTKVNFCRASNSGIEDLKEFSLEVNHAEWSPTGGHLVLASFRGRVSHRLYFIDASDLSVMSEDEHHTMSAVCWDPTGRYLASCALASSQTTDAGYTIWSFQGRKLLFVRSNELSQFLWRPRHPTLLTEQKMKEIRRNLKNYSAKFKAIDDLSASKLSSEQLDVRKKMAAQFFAFKQASMERLQQQAARRLALRHGAANKPQKYEEESFDFLLSIDEEFIHV